MFGRRVLALARSAPNVAALGGTPTPTPANMVLAAGDSITASNAAPGGASYSRLWAADHPTVTYVNEAVGGSGLGNSGDVSPTNSLYARQAAALAYNPSHLTVLIGANDLSLADLTGYRNRLYAYIAPFKAAGAKVILCTVLPRTGVSGFNAGRATFNNLLRADKGVQFDDLVDFDTTSMGVDGAENNTSLYYDGLHPTPAGHTVMKRAYATVVNWWRSIPNEPLDFAFAPATDVVASTATDSASYTVTGLYPGETRPISITGGTYSKNGGAFTSSAGTVVQGDVIVVRTTSSESPAGQVDAILTIGTTAATFSVITAGAGSTPWTPAALGSKLKSWWKAEDITGDDGSNFLSWTDASGNGNTLTGSSNVGGSGRPKVAASLVNGLNAVSFAAAQQAKMAPASPSTYLSGRTSSATFFVSKNVADPGTAYGPPIGRWGSNDGDYYPFSNGGVYSGYGRGTRIDNLNPTPSLAAWHVGMFLSAPSDWRYALDGTNVHSTTSNTVSMGTNPVIGVGAGGQFDGHIAEIVDMSSAPTTLEQQKVEGYLAWKFGLQANLPGAHPYASAAPTM